jgi:hypothetical protein
MFFKKGGKLKATERWKINGKNIDVVDKFNYLGVTLDRKLEQHLCSLHSVTFLIGVHIHEQQVTGVCIFSLG